MIKNFIILRMYRVIRYKFINLKESIKDKKAAKSGNVVIISDFDTNDGKGYAIHSDDEVGVTPFDLD